MTNGSYLIEENVPVPVKRRGRGGRIYPFGEMKVGDSFFAVDKTATQLRGAVSTWTRANPSKWIAVTENGGARIWRVE